MSDPNALLPSWETAVGWYTEDELITFINRKRSVFDDERQRIPTDVTSREFAVWMTNEYRMAMAKGIQMANSRARQVAEFEFREMQTRIKELEAHVRANGELIESLANRLGQV